MAGTRAVSKAPIVPRPNWLTDGAACAGIFRSEQHSSDNNDQDRAHLEGRQQNLDRATHPHTEIIDRRHDHHHQRGQRLGRREGEFVAPEVAGEQRRGHHRKQESQESHKSGRQGGHAPRAARETNSSSQREIPREGRDRG